MMRKLLLTILLLTSVASHAATDVYPFESEQKQAQFNRLSEDLRCLVCQNQSLADSQAPLAKDLRHKLYLQVKAGKKDNDILKYFTDRYGQFVLFKPAFNQSTFLLWLTPLALLMFGFFLLFKHISRKHS